ncbi:MAG: hypothetical protein PHV05_13730 [Candidatus Riflebacteria bacterium]|nr:hypothetical protein [Candidatus Riflebacteria bacterium]
MSFKNLVKSLLFVFLLSISGITEAKPFLLNYEDVNMGLLEEKNVLTDFKAQYAPQVVMMKTMEAVQGGQLDPEDPESMKAFEKQLMDKYYQDAFALRKTIKEPQMRLLLDKEIVRSLGEQGETEKIYNLITKAWDGSSKLFLAMAAFDALKSSKFNDIGQLKKIFEEGPVDESTPLGKKTRLVASGFLINPAGMMFPNFPDGKKTTDGEPLSIEDSKGR